MSWFSHTLQGPGRRPPSPQTLPSAMEDLSYACLAQPRAELQPVATAPTSLAQFPSVPKVTAPPSLEDLSCSSAGLGVEAGPMPLSYVTMQEQRCVLSWFQGWGVPQRERFLQDLLSKAVPGKVCTLLEQLNTLQVQDRPPNIFECQLRLWSQWFESWSEAERNSFLQALEDRDPIFTAHFYRGVAGTAGRQ
ncbi:uncharacterized protein C14orf119 homolog [Conger conger]|uniref:uncharacterized protein C14orf119 homolog n=1 Tax=Conger conger TaxID=82655 RepID=UPI002A5A06CF|nr:uncharacterized protein C14orf119 homolog [Conger conger]XP_061109436.1 uncharacterized protein C14orf119 homolog [Conger conger]XP_061109437.1 uncharacterized protein C14orf119 homolog [Conger conger]